MKQLERGVFIFADRRWACSHVIISRPGVTELSKNKTRRKEPGILI